MEQDRNIHPEAPEELLPRDVDWDGDELFPDEQDMTQEQEGGPASCEDMWEEELFPEDGEDGRILPAEEARPHEEAPSDGGASAQRPRYTNEDFGDRYIWDEETGRLYEVVQRNPKKRGRVLALCFGIGIIGAALAVPFFPGRSMLPQELKKESSILTGGEAGERPAANEIIQNEECGGKQAAGECPKRQYVTSDIVVDGRVRATLASAEAAEEILSDVTAYFDAMAPGEGERHTLMDRETEVLPRPDAAPDEIKSYEEVFALFTSPNTPIRVATTVVSRKTQMLPFDTRTEKDSSLVEGTSRIAAQGREGSETAVTTDVYINGKRSGSRSSVKKETVEPQDRLILLGSQKPEKGQPGRHEGKKGKEPEGLSFSAPGDGKITANFGQIQGVLHLGLDYAPETSQVLASEAGVVVTAMDRGGYGLTLEIDHGQGFVTRYALLGSAAVSIGDRVEKNQPIGSPGLGEDGSKIFHFELRIDGVAFNPRYYIE